MKVGRSLLGTQFWLSLSTVGLPTKEDIIGNANYNLTTYLDPFNLTVPRYGCGLIFISICCLRNMLLMHNNTQVLVCTKRWNDLLGSLGRYYGSCDT